MGTLANIPMHVSYAASSYPSRRGEDDAALIADSFSKPYKMLSGTAHSASRAVSVIAALPRFHPVQSELPGLAASLGSAATADDTLEGNRRAMGGALYLTTRPCDEDRLVFANWRDQAPLVDFVRRHLPVPPSVLVRDPSAGNGSRPDERALADRLAAMVGASGDAGICAAAAKMEMAMWYKAHELGLSDASTHISDIWRSLHERLVCGFPYYAFRSRLHWWWKSSSNHALSKALRARSLGQARPSPAQSVQADLERELELEFTLFEGHRLVRSSFYKGSGPAVAAYHEERRREIDDLVPEAHGTAPTGGNVLLHRLRWRSAAYLKSRLAGWSDGRIRRARRTDFGKAGPVNGRKQPLLDEPGWSQVTGIARLVAPDRTLLGALAARLFLQRHLDRKHELLFTFRDFLREFWHWACKDEFWDLVENNKFRAPEKAFLAAMKQPPLASLLATMRSLQTVEEWDAYAEGRDFAEHELAAAAVRDAILGPGVWARTLAVVGDWPKLSVSHWAVPIWYALCVDRVPLDRLESHLAVDPEADRDKFRDLARRIVRVAYGS